MSTPKREMSPPQVLRELYDAQRSPVPQSASLVQGEQYALFWQTFCVSPGFTARHSVGSGQSVLLEQLLVQILF